ncbi:MAG: hypothetical protein PHV02_09855 [Rhodocyclaceae bacterium]|nr:hypothetical protein [Rhodocyclaceae bacterium]
MKNESSGQKSVVEVDSQLTTMSDQLKRRRVLLGGSVGAVLASMKSGSALAGGVCSSPSAFGSIAANPATSAVHNYTGCTPSSKGVYANQGNSYENWGNVNPVLTLRMCEFTIPGNDKWTLDTKVYDILAGLKVETPQGKVNLWDERGGHLLVMYMDVLTDRAGDALNVFDVRAMWQILFTGSTTYEAKDTAVVSWTADMVQTFYLKWVGKA